MYSSLQLSAKFLHYYLTAFNSKGHGMHSPFVFDFILNVLNNKKNYHPPKQIEKLRGTLLNNNRNLSIEDLGAGSRVHARERSVKTLAKTAIKSKKYSQLLYRLVKHYKPENIIELGTSLGITTAYFSLANPDAKIISIEGSSEVAMLAQENFQKLQVTNVRSIVGNFDDHLYPIVSGLLTVDLAYIDGNHRLKPTINYFEHLLPKTNNNSILVFDDIHWSSEMEAAWEEIKKHPSVRCTIDIFFLGFVFFRKEFKEKQNFTVRF
jgi:predicted O-methyltransferase YrrM